MEYFSEGTGRRGFRLENVTVKNHLFSKKKTIRSDSGTYEVRPATEEELAERIRTDRLDHAARLVQRYYGEDVCYMAPEQILELSRQL